MVVKGYNQRPGIDFGETFSPVVKPVTIHVVLTLAVTHSWPLVQLDVNNTFLYGILEEHVFMKQPPGFTYPAKQHHVCKLVKALYGLKQAPRAWYQALRSFTLKFGFWQSQSDHSLFIYRQGTTCCYFLVYVDDLIVTGNNSSFIKRFIQAPLEPSSH